MEIIKRKILREDIISRSGDTYGSVDESHIYFNIFLTQTVDNMGMFTDMDFVEGSIEELDKSKILEGYRPSFKKKSWHKVGDKTTAVTDSKYDNLRGYKADNRFKVGFDIEKETYLDFRKYEIRGVSRVTEKTDDLTTYVIDANYDGYIGTDLQNSGLLYRDADGITTVTYNPQGLNDTNSSLSAITKEEYLMGIISKTETKNDVFIDRGESTVTEPHLRLSEVETLEHLMKYGNGYFNVVK